MLGPGPTPLALSDVDRSLRVRDSLVTGVVQPLPASIRREARMKRQADIARARSAAALEERREEAPRRQVNRRLLAGVFVAGLALLLAGSMAPTGAGAPVTLSPYHEPP